MTEKKISASDQKLISEVAEKLASTNETIVLKKLHSLKSTGNAKILPLVLDLLTTSKSEIIISEVITMMGQLKDPKCTPVIVEYIQGKKVGEYLSDLIASCWQSGLDFSQYLAAFAECFITGNYQVALESFTVIEEMLINSDKKLIEDCRTYLLDQEKNIDPEKKLLFKELIKVIENGTSQNVEDYPEFFER
jgi:hypothetical protein